MLLPQCAQLQCHKRGSAAASLSPILMEQQIPLSSLHTHKFPCLSLSLPLSLHRFCNTLLLLLLFYQLILHRINREDFNFIIYHHFVNNHFVIYTHPFIHPFIPPFIHSIIYIIIHHFIVLTQVFNDYFNSHIKNDYQLMADTVTVSHEIRSNRTIGQLD